MSFCAKFWHFDRRLHFFTHFYVYFGRNLKLKSFNSTKPAIHRNLIAQNYRIVNTGWSQYICQNIHYKRTLVTVLQKLTISDINNTQNSKLSVANYVILSVQILCTAQLAQTVVICLLHWPSSEAIYVWQLHHLHHSNKHSFCLASKVKPTNTLHLNIMVYIYYCMTGRAIWGHIQLEGGSIGPTEGRDN